MPLARTAKHDKSAAKYTVSAFFRGDITIVSILRTLRVHNVKMRQTIASILVAFSLTNLGTARERSFTQDWPQFRGHRAAGVSNDQKSAGDLERGERYQHPVEDGDSRPRARQSDRPRAIVSSSCTAESGRRRFRTARRSVWRHCVGSNGAVASLAIAVSFERHWADCCGNARSSSGFRKSNATRRRRMPTRLLRRTERMWLSFWVSEGLYCYDQCGNLLLEKGPGRARLRLLCGARRPVGIRQLADHLSETW